MGPLIIHKYELEKWSHNFSGPLRLGIWTISGCPVRWRYGLTFDFFAALRGGDPLSGRGYHSRICQSQMHLLPLIPSLKSLLPAKVFLQDPFFC